MKRLYFLLTILFFGLNVQAQDEEPLPSILLSNTCLNPDEGTIEIVADINKNCPEADENHILNGREELGFHSGINNWSTVTAWDAEGAVSVKNDGSDIFTATINTMDYYGVAFEDIMSINMVLNDGIFNPMDPWDAASVRDSTDSDGAFGPSPCSDLYLRFAELPTCKDLRQSSSLALFSDQGDGGSCVDADDGLVKLDLDLGLACPEGGPEALAGAEALGLHSTADGWATSVAWDAPNAVQLVNDGNDNFSAVIDVQSYYGIALADITEITLVGNNGIANPGGAWDNTIKDSRDGGFGGTEPCSDLTFLISEAPACDLQTNIRDYTLQNSLTITPNPFENRAFLEFDNPNQKLYDLVITDMTGRVVREMKDLKDRTLLQRGELATGLYVVTLTAENGEFATTKLMVK